MTPLLPIVTLLALLTIAGPQAVHAQEPVPPAPAAPTPAPGRGKVALALAGGGALGLVHLGVIQWMEEHRIPADYIVGTSIGSVVGGAYATGMTPKELGELLTGINWTETLRGEVPYNSLNWRRKEDRRNILAKFELGTRRGLNLPSGLDPAEPIGLLLSRIGLPYGDVKDFNELPIPFRAVATDLEAGQSVVLSNGSLATAIRASMAIPGIFTPVERDGKLLADGGILANLPTEAAKGLGAKTVIAVDLYTPLPPRQNIRSFVDILGQTISIMVRNNDRRALELADIVIRPDLTGLSTGDFAKASGAVRRGYEAAERQKEKLLALALPETEWNALLAKRQARRRSTSPPEYVQIIGIRGEQKAGLAQSMKPLVNKPLDYRRLDDTLTRATGTGRYESFFYEETRSQAGRRGLLVRAKAKDYGPPFLNAGLDVGGSNVDDPQFTLPLRLTILDVGLYNAELRTDLRLGSTTQLATEYYVPFSDSGWFVAPRIGYLDARQSYFQNRSRLATYGVRSFEGAVDFGYTDNRFQQVRLGASLGHFTGRVRTGDPKLGTLSGGVSALTLRYDYDGQDSPLIASRGLQLQALVSRYLYTPGADGKLTLGNLRVTRFFSAGRGGIVFQNAQVGTGFGANVPPSQQFTLGGPLRLGAYGLQELRGNSYLLLSQGYLYRISELPAQVGGKILVGGWYEGGGTFDTFQNPYFRSNLSGGIIIETLLGPVVIGGSVGQDGRRAAYFSIGRLF